MTPTAVRDKPLTTTNGRPERVAARMEFRRMDHTNSEHRLLMCTVADRIPAFLTRFSPDNPAELIQRFIHSHWLMGSATFAIWAALSPLGRVIGHVIAQIEVAWGVPYVMILQVEIDSPYTTTGVQRRELLAEMDVWAKTQGATKMKTLTPRNVAVYPRHCGFHVDKVLMVRTVGQP